MLFTYSFVSATCAAAVSVCVKRTRINLADDDDYNENEYTKQNGYNNKSRQRCLNKIASKRNQITFPRFNSDLHLLVVVLPSAFCLLLFTRFKIEIEK